ncbi:hypothetical protein BCR33DRAFT_448541 [Rhizoclosmatium globosum]|uniref:IQCH-like ATP-grasp domain-containing protein n=1 Tax=Rhizoclosmatium globosum TaxID=329046 RepID=A0A1Y2BSB1_9FUNG|nr:hypothetical protein BCR33DRAFT_448541 [Rhizoclosmatium globosum]|eukprot:ORY37641.1 hypothetical protein BCR33DRAFT_448541 [Rhizoclosmatium globosum]
MIKYESKQTKEYKHIIPKPVFERIPPPTPPVDNRKTPFLTPNWTPNTAGYQLEIYPPTHPFFSPNNISAATTPRHPDYEYPDPVLTPIETLPHLCHLNSVTNYEQDQECFPVCNGILMHTSPSFVVFREWIIYENKRGRNIAWVSIMFIIRKIETFCSFNRVEWADVSKSKILELLSRPIIQRIDLEDLLYCFSNREEIKIFIESPGHVFRCKGGAVATAKRLAEVVRTKLTRKHHLAMVRALRAAERFVLARRRILKLRYWDCKIAEKFALQKPQALAMVEDLKLHWKERYEGQKRVVIHLPSVSCPLEIRNIMSSVKTKQLQQIGRFRDLLDPNVTIIYVSYPMDEDLHNTFRYYLQQLFFDHRYDEDLSVIQRFHILVPDNHKFFQKTASLTSMLLASVHSMKKLKELVGSAPAYIVPGMIGNPEIELSALLQIPLFSDIEIPQQFQFSPTMQTEFISRCDVAMPPSQTIKANSIDEMMSTIQQTVMENYSIKRWMFKLNNQPEQMGILYWDTLEVSSKSCESIDTMKTKIHQHIIQNAKLVCQDIQLQAVVKKRRVRKQKEAAQVPQQKVVLTQIEIYLELFVKHGGVIQAAPPVAYEETGLLAEKTRQEFPTRFPSVHFLIKPDMTHELICTSDQLSVTPYRFWGCLIPQQSCHSDELAIAALEVVNSMKFRGYFGYITVSFVTWDEHTTSRRHLWCTSVKPYVNDNLVYCMNYLTATSTKAVQPGFSSSGSIHLDLNRARKITFKYLENNKFIDLPKVKRAAKMAAFEGDEDPVVRFGVYTPSFRHIGLSSLTPVGVEALCLDSGFSMHNKWKRGVMALNAERHSPEQMSLLFSEESCSACLELVLKALPVVYRRLMTIESEELSNFVVSLQTFELVFDRTTGRRLCFDPRISSSAIQRIFNETSICSRAKKHK